MSLLGGARSPALAGPFRLERGNHCARGIPLLFAPWGSRLDMLLDDDDQSACCRGSRNTHGRCVYRIDLLPLSQHVDDPEHVHHASDELGILRVLGSLRTFAAANRSSRACDIHAEEVGRFLANSEGLRARPLLLRVRRAEAKSKSERDRDDECLTVCIDGHAVPSSELLDDVSPPWQASQGTPATPSIGSRYRGSSGSGSFGRYFRSSARRRRIAALAVVGQERARSHQMRAENDRDVEACRDSVSSVPRRVDEKGFLASGLSMTWWSMYSRMDQTV